MNSQNLVQRVVGEVEYSLAIHGRRGAKPGNRAGLDKWFTSCDQNDSEVYALQKRAYELIVDHFKRYRFIDFLSFKPQLERVLSNNLPQ